MNEELLIKMLDLVKKKVKSIDVVDEHTVIIFDDGEQMILNGGKKMIRNIKKLQCCSYCKTQRKNGIPMISPDDNEDILICSDCVSKAAKIFMSNGVHIEINF